MTRPRSALPLVAAVAVRPRGKQKQTPKDDINHGYQEMAAEFDSGHVAMIMHNLGSYPQLAAESRQALCQL